MIPLHIVLSLYVALGPVEPASGIRRILWEEPKPLTVSDWIRGPGGNDRAPSPPFQFQKENLGGTNPKIEVTDARGRLWIVKFGSEIHSETFASRLLHAVGYPAEAIYFVPSGIIEGVHGLKRSRSFIGKDGRFRGARFKLRDNSTLAYADELRWSWRANPFLGSHELSGLKILIMLASNWDTKDAREGDESNTAVFQSVSSDPKTYIYSFTDWGASLGHSGGFLKRTKWDLSGYESQTRNFVKSGPGGRLVWRFRGIHSRDITDGITAADVRWLLPYLSRITDDELRAGLVASGTPMEKAERFTRCIRGRIAQLGRISDTNADAKEKTK